MKIILLFLTTIFTLTLAAEEKITCDNIFCAEGQECVEKKSGGAICECIEKCDKTLSPVCGNNGTHMITFNNRCEWLKASCMLEDSVDRTIAFVASSTCEKVLKNEDEETEKIKKDASKPKPAVCMQKDRNSLRKAIISWIKSRVNEDVDHVSYKGLLLKYFNMFDSDKDEKLDTLEFVKLVEMDLTMAEKPFGASKNPLVRGLCLSELIAITDVNSNYKLEFEEFHKCLNPKFHLPHERCELNGKMFEDGSEVPFQCNTCQCACGHWVCTHEKCKKNKAM